MAYLLRASFLPQTMRYSGNLSLLSAKKNLNAVERAFDIVIQPAVHAFYTTQFAGDMHAQFADEKLTLLQTGAKTTSGAFRKT